jgi:mono/diheme cytochrome c family protein
MTYRLKKVLLTLSGMAIGVVVVLIWYVNRTPVSRFDGMTVTAASAELVQRGEYVARLSDCVACHSTPSSKPFAGGLEMATPLGSIYTTNITPDTATGIGNYTLADFDRAVRQGVARDGHRLYPAMPYPSYVKLSDADVQALYAYFMHAVKPANQQNQPSGISWPLSMRWPLALWNGAFAPSGSYRPVASGGAAWNRGAYIVQGPGHCGSCHTPRGVVMNEKALDQSSPLYLSGALLDGWYAPSLRNDPNIGLGRWSEEDVAQFLKTGRNQHAVVFGSMTEAFNNSLQFFNDEDLAAVAHYLKSLPAGAGSNGSPWQYQAAASPSGAQNYGAQVYMTRCSYCHGEDGRGQGTSIPPLAGTASSMARENASSINVTLNGSGRVVAAGVPDAYRMPPFRNQLSDRDIAEVLTYVRTNWGNTGGAVKSTEVKDLRERTNPASSIVTVLQMR